MHNGNWVTAKTPFNNCSNKQLLEFEYYPISITQFLNLIRSFIHPIYTITQINQITCEMCTGRRRRRRRWKPVDRRNGRRRARGGSKDAADRRRGDRRRRKDKGGVRAGRVADVEGGRTDRSGGGRGGREVLGFEREKCRAELTFSIYIWKNGRRNKWFRRPL